MQKWGIADNLLAVLYQGRGGKTMSLDFLAEAKDEYKATIMILKNPEEYGVNLDDTPLMKEYAAALKFIIKYLNPPSPSISKEQEEKQP